MRHLAIMLGTAALVVGAFLAARALRSEDPPPPARQPAPERPAEPASRPDAEAANPGGGVPVVGLPGIEVLHRAHGAVGAAMRSMLALTAGRGRNQVDRASMQEVIHTIKNGMTEDDYAYLLEMFERTKDPSFRWWFSWVVQQIPDPRFVDAMTEVYRLDPARGYEVLATISAPQALARFSQLLDAEADSDMRVHAITAYAHSDWDRREDFLAAIARDPDRGDSERIAALTALGQAGVGQESMTLLVDLALGPAKPIKGLKGSAAVSHPVPDLRSGAVLALMQRGDQETARRLIEAADADRADADFTKIVDIHIASFSGPDLSEFIYDRARRRGYVSAGEVGHLLRDLDHVDRARLRDVLPLIRDPEAKALVQKIVAGG